MGLKPFTFPFTQASLPTQKYRALTPAAARWDMWLRHGLDESVTMAALEAAITIKPAVDVVFVRKTKGALRLAPRSDGSGFKPEVTYTVTVKADASIKDGWGLPLQASISITTTAPASNYFVEAGSQYSPKQVVFPANDPLTSTWDAKVRGNSHCYTDSQTKRESGCTGAKSAVAHRITASNIGSVEDIPKVIAAINGYSQKAVEIKEEKTATVDLRADKATLQTLSLGPASDLLGKTGMFLENRWTYGYFPSGEQRKSRVISKTNLAGKPNASCSPLRPRTTHFLRGIIYTRGNIWSFAVG